MSPIKLIFPLFFYRQETHRNNITVVARLVTEYNAFFACRLSSQEKGIFRGKVLSLERKIWNGVYKLNWGEQSSVAGNFDNIFEQGFCTKINLLFIV